MLWDEEMASALMSIQALSSERRYAVGVTAIDRTLASFQPPVDPGDPGVRLLLQCLTDSRAAIGGEYSGRVLSDDMQQKMTAIVTEGDPPGIPQLIIAVANCYGIPESGMVPEYLLTILSDCCSAVIDHEDVDGENVDEERENPLCVATIQWQRELIAA